MLVVKLMVLIKLYKLMASAVPYNIPNGTFPLDLPVDGQVPNSGLKPSSRKEFEVGTEMDFFKNRLRFDLAVYQKKVIDDIVPVSIDYTSGYNSCDS